MKAANSDRFFGLMESLRVGQTLAAGLWDDLRGRYSEAHRSYHDLGHLDWMFAALDSTGESSDAIELAIWYHDAVYEPLAKDNEQQSAQLCEAQLGSVLSEAFLNQVVDLILATDPRGEVSISPEAELLVDIDLSILGAPAITYESYRLAVRDEYAEVPWEAFRVGRSKILKGFLEQAIYRTHFFRPLEERARTNLQREIDLLSLA